MYVMNTNVSCPRVSSWHLTHHCSFGVPSPLLQQNFHHKPYETLHTDIGSTISCMHVHLYSEFIQAVCRGTIQATANQLCWPGFAVQLIVHLLLVLYSVNFSTLKIQILWVWVYAGLFGGFHNPLIFDRDIYTHAYIYTHGRPWCIVSFKDCVHVVHAPKVTQILFLFVVTLPQDHCAQVNVKSWHFIVWECLLQSDCSCY